MMCAPRKAVFFQRLASLVLLISWLPACQHTPRPAWSPQSQHLETPPPAQQINSRPLRQPLPVPPELVSPAPPELTYSLSVSRVNVQDFLYALARDSKLNVDIHPDIQGTVSLNAFNQTLPQILDRISRQVDLRHELTDGVLRVLPDTPYLVHYPVDYVNIRRQVNATVSANSQISSNPGSDLRTLAQSSSNTGNMSTTRLENQSQNHFWQSLEKNIQDILRETDKLLPSGSSDTITEDERRQSGFGVQAPNPGSDIHLPAGRSTGLATTTAVAGAATENNLNQNRETIVRTRTFREAASVIVNPEGGLISVRATARQHASVQDFLHHIVQTAHRQVLIEATIIDG